MFPSEPVAIICCLDTAKDKIVTLFDRRKERDFPHFLTITYGTGKELRPLQCADLGAGTLRRSWVAIAKGDPAAQDIPWEKCQRGLELRSAAVLVLRQGAVIARAWGIINKSEMLDANSLPSKSDQNVPKRGSDKAEFKAPSNIDFKLGTTYPAGAHVHYAGCAWITRRETTSVPGGTDWLLAGRLV